MDASVNPILLLQPSWQRLVQNNAGLLHERPDQVNIAGAQQACQLQQS